MPHLQTDLNATFSQLQWMVDSYTLVFACLLLTAGSLGDRFGRKGALQIGMGVFGLGSLLSAFATSPTQLIATRALMGVGGAFIMPSTLSLITNVFPPEERGRAISYWAAVAGVGVAIGPVSGGLLLEHYYWGSIFLVNLPIVVVALAAGAYLLPKSKDPSHPRLDLVGAGLSIIGLMSLVYGIIEGPTEGWTSTKILTAFGIAIVVLAAFAWWELKSSHPMLNLSVFDNPRFSAASLGLMLIFFAMFGATFLLTQYLQDIMGFSALKAGAALLPWAGIMLVLAPLSARLAERFGTKLVMGTGLELRDALARSDVDAARLEHQLRHRRVAPPRAVGDRHGPGDGARHRIDHGLVAPRQGRRGLRDERHDPSGRRRARRRGRRQRDVVDVRQSRR